MKIKQYRYGKRTAWLGVLLGGLQYEISAITSYTSYIQMSLIVGTSYVVARNYFPSFLSWINFTFFVILIIVIIVVMMIVDWVFIQPGRQEYSNRQSYKHPNPAIELIKTLATKEDITRLEDMIKEIKENMKQSE